MTRTILQYTLLALAFLFLVTVFRDRAPLWKRLFLFSAPVVCVLCCVINLGDAYFSYTPKWYHVLTTACYVLFWGIFTLLARRSRIMSGFCLFMSAATLCAALSGIAVRTLRWDILTLAAVVLTPFSTLPMYGIAAFTDWLGLELVSLSLSLLWLSYSLYLRKGAKK